MEKNMLLSRANGKPRIKLLPPPLNTNYVLFTVDSTLLLASCTG